MIKLFYKLNWKMWKAFNWIQANIFNYRGSVKKECENTIKFKVFMLCLKAIYLISKILMKLDYHYNVISSTDYRQKFKNWRIKRKTSKYKNIKISDEHKRELSAVFGNFGWTTDPNSHVIYVPDENKIDMDNPEMVNKLKQKIQEVRQND